MTEEYGELIEAIHKDDVVGTVAELYDIAIIAIWGIVSHNQEKIE